MTLTTLMTEGSLTAVGLKLALRRIALTVTKDKIENRHVGCAFCLTDAAAYIHKDNRSRGWWTDLKTGADKQRNVGELLMLMVSEIAEIPAEGYDQHTVKDDKLPERLMFEVELADAAIRIFDTCGALAPQFTIGFLHAAMRTDLSAVYTPERTVDRYLMDIVRNLANAMEGNRKGTMLVGIKLVENESEDLKGNMVNLPAFDFYLGQALHGVFYLSYRNSFAIAEAITEKLEFNAQRADHKPENRLAEGGKAY